LTPRRAPPFFFTVASTKTFKEKGIPMRVASFASFAVMLFGASLSNPLYPVIAQSKASAGTASPARKIVTHEAQDIMTKPKSLGGFALKMARCLVRRPSPTALSA
jgi:hypothetical protein